MPTETIVYDPDGGPISPDVTPGYGTLGKYKILSVQDGVFREIDAHEPRNLGDDVPDVHTLHELEDDPSAYFLVVRGNYMPAPHHPQVHVTYTFRQDADPAAEPDPDDEADGPRVLLTSQIRDTLRDRSFQTYSHRYRLTPDDSP